jgi:hypothetical protein
MHVHPHGIPGRAFSVAFSVCQFPVRETSFQPPRQERLHVHTHPGKMLVHPTLRIRH